MPKPNQGRKPQPHPIPAMPGLGIGVVSLSKRLGVNQALDSVSLQLEPARLHGIIGPDGAGKTTLLRVMMGLLKPDQGECSFFRGSQNLALATVRSALAYMPQTQSLYADLSVGEHLDFFRDLYVIPDRVYRPRREELLHLTRMAPFIDRPAGKLSGGMYKKLGLMCALLQSPQAVLLDEPTTGVDPISRREFWELLYGLVRKGILVVVTTAYMDEAERCSRVHVLHQGRVLASGEPRAILNQAKAKNFEALFIRYERKASV